MLIRKMAFIFHKSKQVKGRVALKILSMKINRSKVSFSSIYRFLGKVVWGQIQFRSNNSGPTIQVARNEPLSLLVYSFAKLIPYF